MMIILSPTEESGGKFSMIEVSYVESEGEPGTIGQDRGKDGREALIRSYQGRRYGEVSHPRRGRWEVWGLPS